jgi:glycosyltransferase involved in cell wall biosynthesis
MIRASVIVASYNRRLHLQRCLECLMAQDCSPDAYEIIVVDDASTDDTWSMLENISGPCDVNKLRLPATVGPAVARNQAIPQARGEVIVFIDSDAFASPGFMREHIIAHERSPRLIVDGPAVNLSWSGSADPLPFRSLSVRAQAWFDFAGACFVTVNTSCRKEHLLAAGAFDPDLSGGYGWEDTELGLRLRKMGLRRLKNRNAVVLHCNPGRASADARMSRSRLCGSNAAVYYRKHPEPSVRRQIRLDRAERVDTLSSLCRLIRAEVVDGEWRPRWPLRYLAARLLLQREYAIGLREGIERHGPPESEVRR